jgi:hypothetical protein
MMLGTYAERDGPMSGRAGPASPQGTHSFRSLGSKVVPESCSY